MRLLRHCLRLGYAGKPIRPTHECRPYTYLYRLAHVGFGPSTIGHPGLAAAPPRQRLGDRGRHDARRSVPVSMSAATSQRCTASGAIGPRRAMTTSWALARVTVVWICLLSSLPWQILDTVGMLVAAPQRERFDAARHANRTPRRAVAFRPAHGRAGLEAQGPDERGGAFTRGGVAGLSGRASRPPDDGVDEHRDYQRHVGRHQDGEPAAEDRLDGRVHFACVVVE
jgi:hypothetical protein